MKECLSCHSDLAIHRVHCPACNISYEGQFALPRLARLNSEHLELAELFLLTGGSMKAMAQSLDTSYPTLRKRVDLLIADLQALRQADERSADNLLDAVESGELGAEEAARIGRELNGTA